MQHVDFEKENVVWTWIGNGSNDYTIVDYHVNNAIAGKVLLPYRAIYK